MKKTKSVKRKRAFQVKGSSSKARIAPKKMSKDLKQELWLDEANVDSYYDYDLMLNRMDYSNYDDLFI